MKKKKKTSQTSLKYSELIILLAVMILSFFLWDTFLLYPVKLFVVIWHEISHGLAAIFSGGKVLSISYSFELGGKCITEDGVPFIVATSGYLGSLLIGAFLFRTSYDKKASKWTCTALSVLLILFTANFVDDLGGGLISLFFAAMLFVSPRYIPETWHNYLWRSLGLLSSLYVVIDIKKDILSEGYLRNDAHIIAEVTGLSSSFWGLMWLLITIGVITSLFWFAYRKS